MKTCVDIELYGHEIISVYRQMELTLTGIIADVSKYNDDNASFIWNQFHLILNEAVL